MNREAMCRAEGALPAWSIQLGRCSFLDDGGSVSYHRRAPWRTPIAPASTHLIQAPHTMAAAHVELTSEVEKGTPKTFPLKDVLCAMKVGGTLPPVHEIPCFECEADQLEIPSRAALIQRAEQYHAWRRLHSWANPTICAECADSTGEPGWWSWFEEQCTQEECELARWKQKVTTEIRIPLRTQRMIHSRTGQQWTFQPVCRGCAHCCSKGKVQMTVLHVVTHEGLPQPPLQMVAGKVCREFAHDVFYSTGNRQKKPGSDLTAMMVINEPTPYHHV